jgi:uncharacterized protein (DUF1684 family)
LPEPARLTALLDWRRQVSELYAAVREADTPSAAHELWRAGRDRLFQGHSESPLEPSDPLRSTGLPYWPYDDSLRFELPVLRSTATRRITLPTGADGLTSLRSVGSIAIPAPVAATVEVWWLEQYGGGLFVPLRDGTAGQESYGGGRYLLDTAKGADLGGSGGALTIDLNFLYHPSCRYDSAWECPLAPIENTIVSPVRAGERI